MTKRFSIKFKMHRLILSSSSFKWWNIFSLCFLKFWILIGRSHLSSELQTGPMTWTNELMAIKLYWIKCQAFSLGRWLSISLPISGIAVNSYPTVVLVFFFKTFILFRLRYNVFMIWIKKYITIMQRFYVIFKRFMLIITSSFIENILY